MISRLEDVTIQSDCDRLVLLLRHLDIKQYEFAREIGYSRVYLESVINGRTPFTEPLRKKINDYLIKKIKEI